MSLAGTTAITELWAKVKANFGHSLSASTTATTASVTLKSATDESLGSAATIPAATTAAAGVMTADDKTKLAGIESGANKYTHPSYTAATAAAVKVGRDATGHVVTGAALTASDVGAAPTSHASTATTYGKGDASNYGHVKLSDSTSGTSGATGGTAATPKAVADALAAAKAYADDAGVTYEDFTGATSSAAGSHGLVPAPSNLVSNNTFLNADGTWKTVPSASGGASSDPRYTDGLMPGRDKAKLNSMGTLAVCSTAAGTAAKTASFVYTDDTTATYKLNFRMEVGAIVPVRFESTNTAAVGNLTLSVEGEAAKPVKYRGANLPSAGSLAANRVYWFAYDGTSWNLVGDLDTDTTYSDFGHATSSAAGTRGLVPAPPSADKIRMLDPEAGWIDFGFGVGQTSQDPNDVFVWLTQGGSATDVGFALGPATATYPGVMRATDKAKLDGMTAGAEPNQNAFGEVTLISDDASSSLQTQAIDADEEVDEFKISFGNQLTLGVHSASSGTDSWPLVRYRPNIYYATCTTAAGTAAKVATLDNSTGFSLAAGVTVAVRFQYGNSATTPTLNVNSTGAKNIAVPSSATAQTTGSGTTYNSWGAYETLLFTYNGTYWVHMGSGYLQQMAYKLAAAAAPKANPALTGTPTAPTAAAGTNTTQLATTAFVQQEIASASVGAASFQGTLSAQSTLESAAYKSGWYWVVGTAGTYAGQACEAGDMVFAVADKGSAYSASDFSVVQNNIVEMTAAEVDAICTL